MRITIAWGAMVWCLAVGAALADDSPQDTQRGPACMALGEPLLSARVRLLKQGWKPTRRHMGDGYAYSGAELQLTQRKIFEVDSCSMDSSRRVLFCSKKGHACGWTRSAGSCGTWLSPGGATNVRTQRRKKARLERIFTSARPVQHA